MVSKPGGHGFLVKTNESDQKFFHFLEMSFAFSSSSKISFSSSAGVSDPATELIFKVT